MFCEPHHDVTIYAFLTACIAACETSVWP